MVAPIYPETARRRGISGWADVAFTGTVSGTVTDVTVTGSDPANVFDGAAIQAVGGWRFKPVVRSGDPVPQRAGARIRFDLRGDRPSRSEPAMDRQSLVDRGEAAPDPARFGFLGQF